MFNAIAIFANEFHRQVVYALAVESHLLTIQRVADAYPTPVELTRLTGGLTSVDVILLDVHDPELFLACLEGLREHYPDTPVVAVGGTSAQFRALALAGIRHCLPFPLDLTTFSTAVSQAIRESNAQVNPRLYAFMPAKAGAGASTVALGAATAIAALGGGSTLCMDADLRSGCLSFALGAAPRGSTQSVLTGAHEMDRFRWDPAVNRLHNVDFLFSSGESLHPLPDWSQYFALLLFAGERYGHILVDLPELVNPATEEIVRHAGSVFLVLTEEALPVRLAERRIADLVKNGIPRERIRLILNRSSRNRAAAEIIEQGLGCPVAFRLPNNYPAVQQALAQAQWPLSTRSDLGRAFLQFAESLVAMGAPIPAREKPAAGFSGLFRSLVTSR
jgi:pilus assembly protein CpaE